MKTETEDKTTASWLKEAQKGYIRMGVLILLSKKPSHGYEIMKEINSRTHGFWQPTPGGVYPILRDLEKSGYIKGRWETQKNRRLKVYKITNSGEAILKRAIIKQAQIFNSISSLFTEFARDVLNIQTTTIPLPPVPSPFTPFLEEKETGERNLETLEFDRTHIRKSIKASQERLKLLDRQIFEIKKIRQTDSSLAPQ
jgi:DNA-binding PadR family transcriptional regulator